jgi:predicted amidohydrolase YtcJ
MRNPIGHFNMRIPSVGLFILITAACSPATDSATPVVESASPTKTETVQADSAYLNGRIYTVDEENSWAEAVAIKDGKFIAVGSSAQAQALIGKDTEVVDLNGAFAMPGIQDAHLHPSTGGANIDAAVGGFVFSEDMTREEIQAALLEYAEANPGDGWIKGMKWGTGSFPPDGKPRKDLIDEVVTDRPVFLLDETNHNAVVNSKGLEVAGITADTPQPQGGVIEKDPETGEPTGFLAEWGMFPVTKLVPRPTLEQVRLAIEMSLEDIDSYGIVAIKDVSASRESYAAFKALDDEGKLNYRVDVAIIMAGALNEEPNAIEVVAGRDQYRTRLVDPDNVKYVADGTPLSGTSIFLEPYINDPGSYGAWLMRDEDIKAIPSGTGVHGKSLTS